jgi:serine/threonine protein kinase
MIILDSSLNDKMSEYYFKYYTEFSKLSKDNQYSEYTKLLVSKKYQDPLYVDKITYLYNLINNITGGNMTFEEGEPDEKYIKTIIGNNYVKTDNIDKYHIDGYIFNKYIASGEYGQVMLYTKQGSNKKYAVKIQSKHSNITYSNFVKNVNNEYNILATVAKLKLGPKVYDFFIKKNNKLSIHAYIIMDYIEADTLNKYLHKNKLTSSDMKLLQNTLKTLHKNKIYHGDLHTDNIFVNLDNKLYPKFILIDFGFGNNIDILNNRYKSRNYNRIYANIASVIHRTDGDPNNLTSIIGILAIHKMLTKKNVNVIF